MMDYQYYLKLADIIGKEKSKCLSRKIGALIITPHLTIVGTGYNGPPRGVPHCNSDVRLDQLVEIIKSSHWGNVKDYLVENKFGSKCPRQILGYKSGEGLNICSAAHAERNALINSAIEGIRTKGCYLVCSCPIPCKDCAIEIINSGITNVICYKGKDYDSLARWLFKKAEIELIEVE